MCKEDNFDEFFRFIYNTNSINILTIQRELKGLLDKALIAENGYSLIAINNAAYKPLPFIRYSPLGAR